MKLVRYSLVFIGFVLLTACGVKESISDAEARISTFHADLSGERYDDIWAGTSADLRKATSKEDFLNLMKAIHRKLGTVQSSKNAGWNANATTGGTFITVQMETGFERGSGVEQFVYQKTGDRLELNGYNINSRDLLVN